MTRFNVEPETLERTRALFAPGGPAFDKPFLDNDWIRIYPDMTYESHEICTGCQPDGGCPFHICPHGVDEIDCAICVKEMAELIEPICRTIHDNIYHD